MRLALAVSVARAVRQQRHDATTTEMNPDIMTMETILVTMEMITDTMETMGFTIPMKKVMGATMTPMTMVTGGDPPKTRLIVIGVDRVDCQSWLWANH